MRQLGALAVMAFFVASSASAQSGRTLQTTCQKNLSDGRILVSDGRAIPDGYGFKVVKYTPRSRDSGWSTGPCTVVLRKL